MSQPTSKSRNVSDAMFVDEVLSAMPDSASQEQGKLSPRLFYEIVQQSPLAISITDENADILYVNPAFETLTGYQKENVLGENESLLSHKQTPVKLYKSLWAAIKNKQTWNGNLVNRRENGDAYLAELHISPVLNRQGDITNFLGIHRDVTKLHALEKQVLHQKALIESVLDAAPVVVALIDSEKKVILDNQAYKKLLGDFNGQEPAKLFLDTLALEGIDLQAMCRETRGFDTMEVRLDRAGRKEPRWFSVSGTWLDELDSTAGSYFNGQTKGRCCLLLVAHETSALKRQMEQARIQHLRASLAEQQRIQGMREALSGAVFQLQSPVNMMQAAAGLLERGTSPERTREVLDQVLVSAQQAIATLRGALPSELAEGETRINLNMLLRDVMMLMTDDFLAQGVVIDWHPQTVLRPVVGRPNQLRGVFMRLFENALLAMGDSGKDYRGLRITTRGQEESIEVLIQDNGPGIPEELRLKVFEPFFTGWKLEKGRAGMGLALVQDIVNQHGGVIDVNPVVADGCQIRITFPSLGSRADNKEVAV